jgi:hypothetical protein
MCLPANAQRARRRRPPARERLNRMPLVRFTSGTPASGFTLNQVSKLFTQDSREVSLSLKRGQKPMEIKIKLRRLI